jgi:hypothetical protein
MLNQGARVVEVGTDRRAVRSVTRCGAPGGRALPSTACLATARLEGPVLAPEALRTAELSQPVPWPGPACCSV